MITSEGIVGLLKNIQKFRKKILLILALPLIFSVIVYIFSNYLIEILSIPLNGLSLYFVTPVDGVMGKVTISIYGGIIGFLPILAYIVSSLFAKKIKKKRLLIIRFLIIPFGIISFAGGIVFAYFFVIPTTISFLLSCGNEYMIPTLRGSEYFSFILILLVTIGVIFELPIILSMLARIGIVNSKILKAKRRVAIFIIFIVVALITPSQDAFTLIIVAMPMILLYEISIWWIFITEKRGIKNAR